MTLQGVVRGRRRPPRIVLYGPAGIGKSTFGASAPQSIFVPTEDGVDNVPVDQFEKVQTWEDVQARLQQVATEKHNYRTVVLDTLNGAVDLAAEMVCKNQYGGQWTAKKGDGGFLGWAQGWKSTAQTIRSILRTLDYCRKRDMTVILLAHTGLHNVRHPSQGDYTKFAPEMDKAIWSPICAWADMVLRADYEYVVVPGKSKMAKGRAVGSSVRKLYTVGSAAEDAKTRAGYELPEVMDLDWLAIENELGKPNVTIQEVQLLWNIMDEEQSMKALAYLGVDSATALDSADLHKLKIMLNRLRMLHAEQAAAQDSETEDETTIAGAA